MVADYQARIGVRPAGRLAGQLCAAYDHPVEGRDVKLVPLATPWTPDWCGVAPASIDRRCLLFNTIIDRSGCRIVKIAEYGQSLDEP